MVDDEARGDEHEEQSDVERDEDVLFQNIVAIECYTLKVSKLSNMQGFS